MNFHTNVALSLGIFLLAGLFTVSFSQHPTKTDAKNPSRMMTEHDLVDHTRSYDLVDHMRTYAEYNLWANQQMADWLKNIPEDRARQEIESSFPSIRKTAFHLWFSEYGWSHKIHSGEWERPDSSKINQPTTKIWEELLVTSQEIVNEVVSYEMGDWMILHERGEGKKVKRIDIFHQLFNHATYHRGQCITMGRQLGLKDPPRTDYLYYISQR
jgi:uncharacterized damage-inducible protein DinB